MSNTEYTPTKRGFQMPGLSIFFTILLLAILIGTGVYAFIQSTPAGNDETSSEEVAQKIEEMQQTESEESEENQAEEENGEQPEEPSEESEPVESTEEEVSSDDTSDATTVGSEESITVTANNGDGVTHLAREAIRQYEDANGIDLSAEQKLYAETVLTNQNYQSGLSVGESITFDSGSLDQVVTDALDLSPSEIQAWGAYVHLVPSLQ